MLVDLTSTSGRLHQSLVTSPISQNFKKRRTFVKPAEFLRIPASFHRLNQPPTPGYNLQMASAGFRVVRGSWVECRLDTHLQSNTSHHNSV